MSTTICWSTCFLLNLLTHLVLYYALADGCEGDTNYNSSVKKQKNGIHETHRQGYFALASKYEERISILDENFEQFFSAITFVVRQITWHLHKKTIYVAILSHQNCSADENIINLTSMLESPDRIKFKCYQTSLPFTTDDIEFVRTANVQATILLLPWFTTEVILERFARYGIDESYYVALGISQSRVRSLKNINTYMKVSNILANNAYHHECEIVELSDVFVPKSNISLTRQQERFLVCNSIQSEALKVVTLEYKGFHVLRLPGVIPNPDRMNNCPPGSLPCRKSQRRDGTLAWQWYCCRGQFIDVFQLILEELPTKYEIYFVEDDQFGTFVNGTWNGVINDVRLQKADLGMHLLNVVGQRYSVVDFTFPIHHKPETYGVLIKKTEPSYIIFNWSYLSILDAELIVICVLFTILTAAFVIGAEKIVLGKRRGDKRYPSREGMSSVAGILLQRDLGAIISHTWSGQTVSMFFALGMTVFVSSYTAHLTADNIDREEDSFKGLNDKKFKDSSYRVGLTKGVASEMFYNRLPDMYAEKLYFKGSPYQALYDGVIDAFVCSSDFIQEYLNGLSVFNNALKMYRDDRYQMEYAFAIQKNSVVGKKISDIILKLGYQGKLKEIHDKWVLKKPSYHRANNHFPWEYAGGYMLVLAVAVGLCIVILLLEHLYTYRKEKRKGSYELTDL